jgi:O-acetyl-ADP-ribose deacetylase
MPLEIVRNDLTKMEVDVIVNAANSALQMGGGVCGAIFNAAGATELQAACDEIGGCPVGDAVMTDGFQLPAKNIIHTVGPIWKGGNANEETLLRNCYKNSLALAVAEGYGSIAFPLISSGIYGYPREQAFQVAMSTISEFLLEHDIYVYLVVFNQKAFGISKKLFTSIEEYIDAHYVDEHEVTYSRNRRQLDEEILREAAPYPIEMPVSKRNLEDVLAQMDESFSESLLRLIDEKGMTDAATYRKANIDRRLFSKIRNAVDYTPLKKTVIAFAIALELNLDETIDLLAKAGYTLSQSYKFDLIIGYFIEEEVYNIHEINEVLFSFDQVLLGA